MLADGWVTRGDFFIFYNRYTFLVLLLLNGHARSHAQPLKRIAGRCNAKARQ